MAQTRTGVIKACAGKLGISAEEYTRLVDSGLKNCFRCKQWLNLESFKADKTRYDGKNPSCTPCRNAYLRSTYEHIPKELRKPMGPAPAPGRDGDKLQARARVNQAVKWGRLPPANDIPCVDCGHIGSSRRHEYDHHKGYIAKYQLDVESVCTLCHRQRERNRKLSSNSQHKENVMPTKISWATETWNVLVGCSPSGPECLNCYAKIAANSPRLLQFDQYQGIGEWDGTINYAKTQLLRPFEFLTPQKFFVNSMGDTHHPNQIREHIDEIYAVAALNPQHTFQILTKHPGQMEKYHAELIWERLHEAATLFWDSGKIPARIYKHTLLKSYFRNLVFPLPNVWLGTSVGWQKSDWRAKILRRISAKVRFLSCEPLIEPFGGSMELDLTGIHQVIIGGESGSGKDIRPAHVEHMRSLIRQCREQDVAPFLKQLGRLPHEKNARIYLKDAKGANFDEFPDELRDLKIREFPKI